MKIGLIKNSVFLLIKIIFLLFLFLFFYYVLFLNADSKFSDTLIESEKYLNKQKNYLSQSRIALVEMIKMDPDSKNFVLDKRNSLKTIKEINEKALEEADNKFDLQNTTSFPNEYSDFINKELKTELNNLSEKNKNFLLEQKDFLSELEAVNFPDQTEFLKSDRSIKFLTDQTNLILEYDFLLEKVNYYQKKLAK
jgi:hypothetical protein